LGTFAESLLDTLGAAAAAAAGVVDVASFLCTNYDSPSVIQQKINCTEMGTGMILLADIGPSLLLKLVAPFFIQRVACGSLSCGLGDVTFLTMATFYESSVISTWSSGTGAAGIAGSVFYAVVTTFVSPEVTLRATVFVPVAMLFTYLFMLDKPSLPAFDLLRLNSCKSVCCLQRTHYTVLSEDESAFEAYESLETNTQLATTIEQEGELEIMNATPSLDPSGQDMQSCLDWTTKRRLLMAAAYCMISLFTTPLRVDRNNCLMPLYLFSSFRFQVLYQCGVFISRSSVRLVQFKRTWIMAVLQALNFGICLVQTIKPFMPSIWLMFAFILYEGILGGLSYVNTFHRIITEVSYVLPTFPISSPQHRPTEPAYKEYSMAVAAFADGLGITAAGLLSVPLHNALCRLLR
uniref:Battenin n=1 Tax=Schistocephalus solidus TaxID=70667 RepID=A0A183SHE4_SCHSO